MSTQHVLVVEDNAMNADVLRENLIDAGYTFVLAVNGAAGVAIANDLLPDIILMDVNLPILDGLSATRLLKKNTTTQGIPIVALTARAMAGDQEMCLAAGCDDYISKPVDVGNLLAKMQHHLERRPPSFVEMIQRQRVRESQSKGSSGAAFPAGSASPEQVEALNAMIERLETDLSLAQIRLTELDDAVADRERQLATVIQDRDTQLREAATRIARLTEERDRLLADRDSSRVRRDPVLRVEDLHPPEQSKRSPDDIERAARRSRKLIQQLEVAQERNRELQQQLDTVPSDIRALQGQYDSLRKAFLQLHRSVLKSAEEALHHVAFGSSS